MSYFDTVRCSSCNAQLDPESLGGRRGLVCPSCGSELKPADLFNLSDAFVGVDDDQPDLGLDDLMRNLEPDDPMADDGPQPDPAAGALALMRHMKKNR